MTNYHNGASGPSGICLLRSQIADAYDRKDQKLLEQLSKEIDAIQLCAWRAAEAR